MAARTSLRFLRVFPRTAFLYIVREFCLSFAISFLFFFVVFFINQILLLAEDILAKNAPLDQTILLLLYSLPSVVAIAFPFSALAGALMTSARLNTDNEILAFSALGVSPATLYAPFLVMGLVASLLSFAANDYFLPRSAVAFRRIYGQLVARSASIELTPFSAKRYTKAIVVTGAGEGGDIGDILLFETDEKKVNKVISAGRASIAIDPDGSHGDTLRHLHDGIEGVLSLENAAACRDTDNRQCCMRCDHPRQVGRHPRYGNDDLDAFLARILCVGNGFFRIAVCR